MTYKFSPKSFLEILSKKLFIVVVVVLVFKVSLIFVDKSNLSYQLVSKLWAESARSSESLGAGCRRNTQRSS